MKDKLQNIDIRLILLAGVVFLTLLLYRQCETEKALRSDLQNAKNNQAALVDSVRASKNKAGELQFQIRSFISSIEDLKVLNSELASEVNKQRGQVAQLTKIVGNLSTKHDDPAPGINISKGQPCDSLGGSFISTWESYKKYDSLNWRILKGQTTINLKNKKVTNSETSILVDEVNFDLITGLTQVDDHFEIFVKSNYPGFRPTSIRGAYIPNDKLCPKQEPKKWSFGFGPQLGIGVTGPNVSFGYYFGAGFSLQYTLLNF